MYKKNKSFIWAVLIAIFSMYLAFAILIARKAISFGIDTSIFFSLGFFLYRYYLESAFYIPLYLLVCAVFIMKKNFCPFHAVVLALTIFPFFTVVTTVRILSAFSQLTSFEMQFVEIFRSFAPLVLFIAIFIEIVAIVKIAFFLSDREKNVAKEIKIEANNIVPESKELHDDKSNINFNIEKETVDAVENDIAEPHDKLSDENNSQVSPINPVREGYKELKLNYKSAATPMQTEGEDSENISQSFSPVSPLQENNEIYDEPAYYRLAKEEGRDLQQENAGVFEDKLDEVLEGELPIVEEKLPVVEEEIIVAEDEIPVVEEEIPVVKEEVPVVEEEVPVAEEEIPIVQEEINSSPIPVLYTEPDDDNELEDKDSLVIKEYFASQKPVAAKKKKYDIPFDILDEYMQERYTEVDEKTKRDAEILRRTLAEFKIEAEVTGIRKGPVITMFEILPAPGVKISKITNLADNIALRLAASRVRIVAPIPGKHAVGIEVPNRERAIVSFRELIEVPYPQYEKYDLPIVLGKDITGEEQIIDLTQTPHLLIAGATGSGKSVCVNSIIATILYKRNPTDVKMILIDPKIVELKVYNGIPHLLTPVITDSKKAFQALQYCIYEMEKRYALLDALGVRNISSFNKKIKTKNLATMPLPYIVVIIDEFADLMATTGKELESTLARLAAMSRAVGIHLVLATQRPSIDVITGLIKANIPSRIAFMVASKTDARIILDSVGAEMLLGRGDMLFTSAWNPYLTRIQGAYLTENEAERIADKAREYGEPEYIDDEIFIDDDDEAFDDIDDYGEDPLMNKALETIAAAGKASASYLQRRLKIGYNRAARLIEDMERKGIVGPQNGSKPREIINLPGSRKE